MYCSVSITRPEHYMQAILCEGLFEFESQNVSSVYPQQQQQQKNNMAGKFTVGTPNTLEKVWNIDVITWLCEPRDAVPVETHKLALAHHRVSSSSSG